MAKGVVSFVPIHKKKLKERDKKKKVLFKRVLDFLKADNYMFAPLVSSQASDVPSTTFLSTTSTGVEANEPFKGEEQKLFGKVKDYMRSDCYMYAPLVIHQPWFGAAIGSVSPPTGSVSCSETADTGRKEDSTKNVTENARDLGQQIKSIDISDQLVDGQPYPRRTILKHTIVQQETVKHVIQQNCRSSPVQGDEKKEKKGRKGTRASIKGSNTRNTRKKGVAWS